MYLRYGFLYLILTRSKFAVYTRHHFNIVETWSAYTTTYCGWSQDERDCIWYLTENWTTACHAWFWWWHYFYCINTSCRWNWQVASITVHITPPSPVLFPNLAFKTPIPASSLQSSVSVIEKHTSQRRRESESFYRLYAYFISHTHRQSAKLFLQSSELGLPHPSLAGECVPPPFDSEREGHIRLGERGWGVPISTKGQTLWYSVYLCTLWPYLKTVG